MNTTRFVAFAPSALLTLLAACSGSPGGFIGDAGISLGDAPISTVSVLDTGTTGPVDTGMMVVTPIPEAGPVVPDGPTVMPGQCAPNCMMDSDCQASCPAITGALNCCDVTSGVCFTSSESACPDVPSMMGGSDGGGMCGM